MQSFESLKFEPLHAWPHLRRSWSPGLRGASCQRCRRLQWRASEAVATWKGQEPPVLASSLVIVLCWELMASSFTEGLTSEGSLLRLSSADLSIGLMLWKLCILTCNELIEQELEIHLILGAQLSSVTLLTPCVGNQLCFTRGWTHSACCLENIIGIVAWVAEGWFRILYTVPQGDCISIVTTLVCEPSLQIHLIGGLLWVGKVGYSGIYVQYCVWCIYIYLKDTEICIISCDSPMFFAEKRHSAEAALWQVWAYRDYLPIELVADLRCCCEYDGDKATIGCPRQWFTGRAFKESKFRD